MRLNFFVAGIPKPGGSKRAFFRPGMQRPVITDDAGEGNRNWRAAVADFASRAMSGQQLLAGPLRLDIVFHVLRPKGHFGAKGLLPSAEPYPAKRPDVLKLARSTEDAMTGVVYVDDAQIVAEWLTKVYSEKAGAEITVTVLQGEPVAKPKMVGPLLPGMEG
jgi:crossover junction endodeoxyribonuclease RusA